MIFLSLLLMMISMVQVPAQPPSRSGENLVARFNRAVELQQRGNLAEAVAEYRLVIRRKPDYLEAHANLGVVLARLGRYAEAVNAYESALRLAPAMVPIRFNLAIAHYRAGQHPKAIIVLDQVLREQPNALPARQLQGLALSALGRDEEAIARLAPTIDQGPPDAAVLYSLGLAYLRLGRAGFRDILQRLAALPAGKPALHLLQGQAFLRDRDYEQALEELRAAATLSEDLPRLHFSLGVAHSMLGQNRDALAALRVAVARNPLDTPAWYYLADACEKDGNLAEATQFVGKSLALDPQSPDSNGLLGRILLKQGRLAEAVTRLEFAVAAKKSDQELRYALARAYQQLGRRDDAAREFAEVRRLKEEQLRKDREVTPK